MSNSQPVIQDKLGTPIIKGSVIVYSTSLGHSTALQVGKVVDHPLCLPPRSPGNPYVYPGYKIRVRGVDWDDENTSEPSPKLLFRDGILRYPTRIIVVSYNSIPEPIQHLLDSITLVENTL